MGPSRLHRLAELGQSVWIDFLSRDMLRTEELARMMKEDAVVGVTSNPTIFQKAISAGNAYDDQLRAVLEEEQDPKEIFIRLASKDIEDALDLLRAVWDDIRYDGDVRCVVTTAAAATATSRSRSTRASPTTRRARSRRPSASTT